MVHTSQQLKFAQFGGEMAESIGFNKSIGQIYCFLYSGSSSYSLEEISKALNMSKGNASINLRILESWGAVKPVFVNDGSRRDHYEANSNIKEVALRRVQEGLGKRLEVAEERLKGLEGSSEMNGKVKELLSLIGKARKGMSVLPKVLSFLG